MFAAGEDAFQMLRTGSFRGFFKAENMGLIGNAYRAGHTKGVGAKGLQLLKGGARTAKGMWNFSYGGVWPFLLPMATYLGSKAGTGQEVSTAAGFLGGSLAALPGALVAGGPGALISSMLFSEKIGHKVRSMTQGFADRYRKQTEFEFADPKYMDTQAALTMRQTAAKLLSTSLSNARQYLGKEAAFLHQ
jgi:hypothetical protein